MRWAAFSGDSRKIKWDEGSIQPCECASTRDGSRAPMWSHAAFGFMWPMRTFLGSWASVTMTNAERHTPSSGISVTLNPAVAGDLLKRENRRSVVMAYAGTHTHEEPLWPLHSRRIVRFVVRFRRKALPGANRPHDLGLQIRRDRFETAVFRRPERAPLRRGSDGGRETEHLRDRRLRVDDRDLPFLVDVLDHPASALDLPERGAHEILGHVDEDLLDRLQQVFINVPQDFMGAALGEIQSRRGVIEDINQEGEITVIHAKAPVAEMFGFASAIRSATQGRALWSTENSGFEPVPPNLQSEVVRAIRTRKGLPPEPYDEAYYAA